MSDVARRRRELQDATDAVTALVTRLRLDDERFGDPGLRAELATLRLTAEASYAPLAIVGPEGAGKSSLVNALVQAQVSPAEEQEAGTAVPITVSWGQTVAYAVTDDAGRHDVDPATFARQVLQRHNDDNELELIGGQVRLPAPLLADGLTLLDLPGTAGYSARVRQQTAEALAQVRRAVLLVRNRSYGPALRLLEEWRDGLRIDAVVSNWDLDFWVRDPAAVADQITAQRALIRRHLELELPDERIFVLHVPSINGGALRLDSPAAGPSLRAELDRFTAWMAATAGESRVADELRNWTAALAAPVDRLDQTARRAETLLAADPPARRGLLTELDRRCRAELAARHDELLAAARFEPLVAAQRVRLRALLARQRQQLLDAAGDALRVRSRISWLDFDWSGQRTVNSLRQLLDEVRAERLAQGRAAAETVVRQCADPYTRAVDALLAGALPADPDAVMAIHLPQSPADTPAVPDAGALELLDVRRDIDKLAQAAQELATADSAAFVAGRLHIVAGALADGAGRYLAARLDQLARPPGPLTVAIYADARRTIDVARRSGLAGP